MAKWQVIVNTPGYLPMADEPYVLDSFTDGKRAWRDEAQRIVDEEYEPYEGEAVHAAWADEAEAKIKRAYSRATVKNPPAVLLDNRPGYTYDLGVAISLVPYEDENEGDYRRRPGGGLHSSHRRTEATRRRAWRRAG